MSVPLTVVIPTLDEAAQIVPCVAHLRWADEVLVADGGSRSTAPLRSRGPPAPSWCSSAAGPPSPRSATPRSAERATMGLRTRRRRALHRRAPRRGRPPGPSHRHQAYQVRRRNLYLGRELARGHWGRDWVTRLFRRERRCGSAGCTSTSSVGDVGSLAWHAAARALPRPRGAARQDEPLRASGRPRISTSAAAAPRRGASAPGRWVASFGPISCRARSWTAGAAW